MCGTEQKGSIAERSDELGFSGLARMCKRAGPEFRTGFVASGFQPVWRWQHFAWDAAPGVAICEKMAAIAPRQVIAGAGVRNSRR